MEIKTTTVVTTTVHLTPDDFKEAMNAFLLAKGYKVKGWPWGWWEDDNRGGA
jgi:hypothetical protein